MADTQINIQIKIFAWFSEALAPGHQGALVLDEALPLDEASVRHCLRRLAARYARFAEIIYDPAADAMQAQVIVAYNGRVLSGPEVLAQALQAGDTVALIPAYAGG
jgi:molybdopterin converting factor small subunit